MPSSYQPPMQGDTIGQTSVSQSLESNLPVGQATVDMLIAQKGDAIHAVRPQDTIRHAVEVLRDHHIGAVLVIDDAGQMQGILSERDIVRKLAETPGQTLPQQVQDVMTRKVETCQPLDTLIDVLQRMSEGRFRHMPVMQDGTLRAIITIGDVVHYRLRLLEYEALRMKQMIVG